MAKKVLTPNEIRICTVADSLGILTRKMSSIVQVMSEDLGPGDEDAHMDGLVCVMDDLVEELAELQALSHQVASQLRQRVQRSQIEGGNGQGKRSGNTREARPSRR